MKVTVKDITIIALFSAILFVQEQLLSFLPNIQLTMLLIMVYARVFKVTRTTIIVLVHVVLDNLINGSMNPLFVLTMFNGWEVAVLITGLFLNKQKNPIILGLFSILFTCFYTFGFALTSTLVFETSFIAYLANDVLFTVIMCVSSFVSVVWLFNPLVNVLNNKIFKDKINETDEAISS